MSKQNNIFIIGSTGAGKTTVGQALAEKLQLSFYDSDAAIEKAAGMSIAKIFAVGGEAVFRNYEEAAIERLTALNNIVLATGAGAILSVKNQNLLVEKGRVVYLQVSLQQQYERTKRCQERPLLQVSDLQTKLEKMSQERDHFYEKIADLTIKTDQFSLENIVKKIAKIHGFI